MRKAQSTHTALSDEEARDKEVVKTRALEAYILVLKACRKRFREKAFKEWQTHLEFARAKRVALTHWLRSRKVMSFEALCELALVQEFFTCLSREVATHLSDRPHDTLEETATRVDYFRLDRRETPHPYQFKSRPAGEKPDLFI